MPRSSAALSLSTAATAVMLTVLTLQARGTQPVSERPHLTGVWALNDAMSEDVPLLPGEATSRARGAGVLPAVSLRHRSRTGLDLHETVRVRRALREMFAAARTLAFTRESEHVVMTDASGLALRVVPGGDPIRARQAGMDVELRARWQPPSFVIERHYPDRTIVIEQYTTFTEPRQLVITSTIRNPRIDEPAATLLRVYDLVD